MKRFTHMIVVVACAFVIGVAQAEQPEPKQQMPKELQSSVANDFAKCAAYFTVAAEGAEQSGDVAPNKIKAYRKQAANLLELSADLTSKKIAKSRFSMSSKRMMSAMQGSWQNFDVVADKYHYQCLGMLNNPKEYMRHKIRQYRQQQ